MQTLDLIIIFGYLIGITLFGVWFSGKQETTEDYFVGDRSVPWWAIAMSIVATETSTITFISVPGIAFAKGGNFQFLQLVFGYMLGRVVISLLFIPMYFKGELQTVYQLLGERFGTKVKMLASALFVVMRNIADGIRLLLTAIVLGYVYVAFHLKSYPNANESEVLAVAIIVSIILLGVVLGGRLGYVIFYGTAQTLSDPLSIFRTWEGGMSFHGGFFGVILASYLFGKRHDIGLDRLLDLGAAATPVGLGLGRLANFVNGELYGRVTDVPWAFVFPQGGAAPRHPSQLYEFALEGVFLFVVVNIAVFRFKILTKPGRAAGIYAVTYAGSRIMVEFVREPDAQLGFFGGFITMGMILSLPLIAIGVWLLLRSRTPR